MNALHSLLEHLSWMSPPLGLSLVAGMVVALSYAVWTSPPLWTLPLHWGLALAGFAAGQAIASRGPRLLPVGDLALGTGIVVCVALFGGLHALRLWYTSVRRARQAVRRAARRRESLRR